MKSRSALAQGCFILLVVSALGTRLQTTSNLSATLLFAQRHLHCAIVALLSVQVGKDSVRHTDIFPECGTVLSALNQGEIKARTSCMGRRQ